MTRQERLKELKGEIRRYLEQTYTNIWISMVPEEWSMSVPTLLLCREGKLYAIEVKLPEDSLTRSESHNLTKILASGGEAAVCRSIEDVIRFMRSIRR